MRTKKISAFLGRVRSGSWPFLVSQLIEKQNTKTLSLVSFEDEEENDWEQKSQCINFLFVFFLGSQWRTCQPFYHFGAWWWSRTALDQESWVWILQPPTSHSSLINVSALKKRIKWRKKGSIAVVPGVMTGSSENWLHRHKNSSILLNGEDQQSGSFGAFHPVLLDSKPCTDKARRLWWVQKSSSRKKRLWKKLDLNWTAFYRQGWMIPLPIRPLTSKPF